MDKEERFSVHSYCAGVIFGATLISLFLISVNLPAFVCWIYDHETLFTGILALLAALLTTTILVLQIAQERTHKESIRIQKLKASRAVLPLFLSSLTEYTEKSLDLSFRMLKGEDF